MTIFPTPGKRLTKKTTRADNYYMDNAEYDNNNTGALFKNKDRKTDSHPNLRGSITVNGVEYWISSWLKTSKAGEQFYSLAVQPKNPISSDGSMLK